MTIIEDYLKVLKTAYLFNVHLQRNNASISEVVLYVLKIINTLQNISNNPDVFASIKNLCELLIKQLQKRFHYEINSDFYNVTKRLKLLKLILFLYLLFEQAASILRVGSLKSWAQDNWSKDQYSKGFEALSRVYFQLIKRKKES